MTSPEALLLATTARMFHQRPSAMLHGDVVDLALDQALAMRLVQADANRRRQSRQPGQPWGPIAPGLVYADADAALRAELDARKRIH